ncbi:hypothetical protein BCR34DRAFT_479576 [Clohesyomyces aquaticus]|uniref:DUF1993 domain-containing protein n=1 Tax=Clohesyomyces aquaticus TaxID=1231657 RepID=A0A1Y1ZVZ9_9PLEO|nr:hypothetical protein BCR34DRAFT_479576 [Clohesyomyces aquaticus]
MAITIYEISIPPMLRGLKNLSAILKKGEGHAAANNIPASDYTSASLHPDMKPLPDQIHRVSDIAKATVSRITGLEGPSFPDVEQTFPELQDRISKTIAYLESVPESAFDGQEGRVVDIKVGPADKRVEVKFSALEYWTALGQPNFWFHVTTAYGILRMKGVDVGKLDYLNGAGLIKAENGL